MWQVALVLPLLAHGLITFTSSTPGVNRAVVQSLELGSERSRTAVIPTGCNPEKDLVVGHGERQKWGDISPVSADRQFLNNAENKKNDPGSRETATEMFKSSEILSTDHKAKSAEVQLTETDYLMRVQGIENDRSLMLNIVEGGPNFKEKNLPLHLIEGKSILASIMSKIHVLVHVNFGIHERQELTEIYLLSFSEPGLQWKKIIDEFQGELRTLENYLKNIELSSEDNHTFRVKSFKLLNFLLKHQLVEESFVKEWINQVSMLNTLEKHIQWMCFPPIYLGLSIKESLPKSPSSSHLGALLRLINENSWKHIEYQILNKKIKYLQSSKGGITKEFGNVLDLFLKAKFHEINSRQLRKISAFQEMKNHFNSITSGSLNEHEIVDQYGLLQEMFKFISKYQKENSSKEIQNEIEDTLFSKKLDLSQHAFKMLQSARELSFMVDSGLVTVEGKYLQPNQFISWEDAKKYSWSPRKPNFDFKKEFGIYLGHDFETMKEVFKNSVANKVVYSEDQLSKLDLQLGWPNESEQKPFGTEKLSHILETISLQATRILSQAERPMNVEMNCVSKVFIHKTYEWVDKIEICSKELDETHTSFSKSIHDINLSSDQAFTNEMMSWVSTSKIINNLLSGISRYNSEAKDSWIKFSRMLRSINFGMQFIVHPEELVMPHDSHIYESIIRSLDPPEAEGDLLPDRHNMKTDRLNFGLELPVIQFPQIKSQAYYQ